MRYIDFIILKGNVNLIKLTLVFNKISGIRNLNKTWGWFNYQLIREINIDIKDEIYIITKIPLKRKKNWNHWVLADLITFYYKRYYILKYINGLKYAWDLQMRTYLSGRCCTLWATRVEFDTHIKGQSGDDKITSTVLSNDHLNYITTRLFSKLILKTMLDKSCFIVHKSNSFSLAFHIFNYILDCESFQYNFSLIFRKIIACS